MSELNFKVTFILYSKTFETYVIFLFKVGFNYEENF